MTQLPNPFRAKIEKIYGCSYAEYLIVKSADKAIRAFCAHKGRAKHRGIPWEFNLWQWWTIWRESGRWEERGCGGNAYCMSRKGDIGPYSVDNVFIATFRSNSSDHPRKTSGLPMGVGRAHDSRNFCARRKIKGKSIHLGSYATPDLAQAAYLASLEGDRS